MVSKKVSKKGSMRGGDPKTFFLYTTGIGDWVSTNFSLARIWLDILLPIMIRKLSAVGFKNIEISHYEPEEITNMDNGINKPISNKFTQEEKREYYARYTNLNNNNIKRLLNSKEDGNDPKFKLYCKMKYYQNIIKRLLNYNSRVSEGNIDIFIRSEYCPEYLPTKEIEEMGQSHPHLIFDFAQLFHYKYLAGDPKSIPYIEHEEYPNINAIYFGYLAQNEGTNQREINNPGNIIHSGYQAITLRSLIESNFVNIDKTGNVSTYIDRISTYSLLEPILDIRERTIRRSSNRNAKTVSGNWVTPISISSNLVKSENILIHNPGLTIRTIAELAYLDQIIDNSSTPPKTMRNRRPFSPNYIDEVNCYFVNTFMNQIMS